MTKNTENRKRTKPSALLIAWLVAGLMLAVLLSACAPGPAKITSDRVNQVNKNAPASLGNEGQSLLVAGVTKINFSAYTQIPLTASQLEVSSVNSETQGKFNLIQPGAAGYWQIKLPKAETQSWMTMDMTLPQQIKVFGVLGVQGTSQLWQGYRAVLEARNDNEDWEIVARLGLEDKSPADIWVYFILPEAKAFRYYRFLTYDWSFMSLSRIALYIPLGAWQSLPAATPRPPQVRGIPQYDLSAFAKIKLENSQLEVSSYSEPWDKTRLVNTNIQEFWHIKMPRQEDREWVSIDMRNMQPVTLLRIKPRTQFAGQLWDGYTADFEASSDNQGWTTLATLGILTPELTGDWIYFLVGNLEPYRYYRLTIYDSSFFSMSKLELYQIRK